MQSIAFALVAEIGKDLDGLVLDLCVVGPFLDPVVERFDFHYLLIVPVAAVVIPAPPAISNVSAVALAVVVPASPIIVA